MQYPEYWAFAAACVAVLLAVAASWYYQAKAHRAEAQRLQEQVAAMLREASAHADTKVGEAQAAMQAHGRVLSEHMTEVKAQVEALMREHDARWTQQSHDLRADESRERTEAQRHTQGQLAGLGFEVREQLRAQDGRATQDLQATREEFAMLRPEVQRQLEEADKKIRHDFANTQRDVATVWEAHFNHEKTYARHRTDTAQKLKDIGKKIEAVEALARQTEESLWDMRGVTVNVLRSQFMVLQSAVGAGEQHRVESTLERIRRSLASFASSGQRLDRWTLDRVRESVELARKMAPDAVKESLAVLEKVSEEP